MKLKASIIVLGLSLLATGAARACDDVTIDHISQNGDIIETDDGGEYEVTSGSIAGWSEGDEVLVCDGTIIHKDDGEQITVASR